MAELPQFLKDDILDLQAKSGSFGDVAGTLPTLKAAADTADANYQGGLANTAQAKSDLDASVAKLVSDVALYEAGGTPPPPPPPPDTLPGGGSTARNLTGTRTK